MYTLEIYENIYTKSEMNKIWKNGYEYLLDGNEPEHIKEFNTNDELVDYEIKLYDKWQEANNDGYFEDGLFIVKDNQLYRVKFTLTF